MTDALLEIAMALAFGLFPALKELPACQPACLPACLPACQPSLHHCLFSVVAMVVSSLNGNWRFSV